MALIYDIGLYDGADTAFYLAKGFEVVAVEANPELCAAAKARFREEIATNRLTLIEGAIGAAPGTADFHIHQHSDWSRLDLGRDHRFAPGTYRTVQVEVFPFDSLYRQQQVPYYVKLDIEGAELGVIESIIRTGRLPKFLSWEHNLETPKVLEILEAAGYDRFQLLAQNGKQAIKLPKPAKEGTYVEVTFDGYMSGPFGEELPGQWLSPSAFRDELADLSRRQAAGDPALVDQWHDIHARLGGPPRSRLLDWFLPNRK